MDHGNPLLNIYFCCVQKKLLGHKYLYIVLISLLPPLSFIFYLFFFFFFLSWPAEKGSREPRALLEGRDNEEKKKNEKPEGEGYGFI